MYFVMLRGGSNFLVEGKGFLSTGIGKGALFFVNGKMCVVFYRISDWSRRGGALMTWYLLASGVVRVGRDVVCKNKSLLNGPRVAYILKLECIHL